MLTKWIAVICWVSGGITMLAGIQFILPEFFLSTVEHMNVTEPDGIFFARHWGLLVFVFGVLICLAARRPDLRRTVLAAAGIEKLGYAALVALSWSDLPGLHASALFDGACVLLYGAWLAESRPP
jgi:hypothetical protein